MVVVRNQYRASKMLSVLGIAGGHRAWVDSAYMRRYLLALCMSCGDASSFAFASDKSRGSGRDWLSCMSMPFEQKVGWLAPVVATSENPSEVRAFFAEVWCVHFSEFCAVFSEVWCCRALRPKHRFSEWFWPLVDVWGVRRSCVGSSRKFVGLPRRSGPPFNEYLW